MLSLKESIVEHIKKEFSSVGMGEDDQFLLGNLILKKIFDGDFYRGNYYISSLCIHHNNTSSIILNAYSSSSFGYGAKTLYSVENENEYSTSFSFSNIKRYLISNDVFSRVMRFANIIKEHSSSIDEYTDKLIEAHKGDNEFLTTVNNFDYLFTDEDKKCFFTNEVNLLMHKKGMKKISSQLCKDTLSFAYYDTIGLLKSYEEKEFNDEQIKKDCQKKWARNKAKRNNAISHLIDHVDNIENYYKKYQNKIEKIINLIKEEKPFLFEKPKLEDISFSFFETKKVDRYHDNKDYRRDIELESRLSISREALKEKDIEISDVYKMPNVKHNSKTYSAFEEQFHEKMFTQKNEIINNISHRFNGLDFWGEGTFKENNSNNCYLLAKHNDEVIGFLSFSSSEHNIPLIKSVEYVSIKNNFRGIGLAEKIYDNLMYIINHHDYILTTSCYSDEGAQKLPKLKDRVKSKYPNLLMMNTVDGDLSYLSKKEESLQTFKNELNLSLLREISDNEEYFGANIKKRKPEIIDFLRSTIKEIDENEDKFSSSKHNEKVLNNQRRFIENSKAKLIEFIEKPILAKKNKVKI